MKTTFKLIAVTAVATSVMASQAFAGDSLGQERLAERNAAYFGQTTGHQTAAAPSQYDTATSPQQRLGQRNAEYWAGKGSSKAASSQPSSSNTMEYSHPTKR